MDLEIATGNGTFSLVHKNGPGECEGGMVICFWEGKDLRYPLFFDFVFSCALFWSALRLWGFWSVAKARSSLRGFGELEYIYVRLPLAVRVCAGLY